MKKLFSTLMLVLVALTVQAQILQPVKWKIQLNDSGSAEKEIVFTATADKGWHLYDQDLPEGGPVSTSFTFETLKGAELIGSFQCLECERSGDIICQTDHRIRRTVRHEPALVSGDRFVHPKVQSD